MPPEPLTPIRPGRQAVNIVVLVEYQEGGDALVDECYTLTSDDAVFSASDALAGIAKDLERWSEVADGR